MLTRMSRTISNIYWRPANRGGDSGTVIRTVVGAAPFLMGAFANPEGGDDSAAFDRDMEEVL